MKNSLFRNERSGKSLVAAAFQAAICFGNSAAQAKACGYRYNNDTVSLGEGRETFDKLTVWKGEVK